MNAKILIAIIAIALIGLFSFTFQVDQRETAIKLKFGKVDKANIPPGLHLKIPFMNVIEKYDNRILTLDVPPTEFPTNEKKYVKVDFFAKWRIKDVEKYYLATSGIETKANQRLELILVDGLKNEFGKRTIQEVVSGERAEIMDVIQIQSNEEAKNFGIEVVDVRVSKIDLPDSVSDSVFKNMRAERDRVAKDFRARGREQAEVIRARADKERTVIIANAYNEAEQVRGDGDAKSAEIYAQAFTQDEEFYSFTRSLKAYINTFNSNNDVLIMEPDSEFFRYFKKSEQ
ncbi:MAG: protease modulator HflC [Gammaproteobacteria bacterium]|nr:MAG: protease modulator HflC [Gammaproteobacteria bacterium]